jgi:hypothetical protein
VEDVSGFMVFHGRFLVAEGVKADLLQSLVFFQLEDNEFSYRDEQNEF